MNSPIMTLPGVATLATLQHRHLFTDTATRQAIVANAVIAGALSRDAGNAPDPAQLRAGLVMGRTTANGKYRPSIVGLLAADYASGGTALTVSAGVAAEVARLIAVAGAAVALTIIGPPAAGGVVSLTAVTCSAAAGTTLTVTNLGANKAAGSIVAPADGAQQPVTFMPEGYGQPVQDGNGQSVDQLLSPFYNAGDVEVGQIVHYPTEASTRAWLKQQLRATADFTFSDDR